MDLLKKNWIKKGNINYEITDNNIIVSNDTDQHGFLIYPHVFKNNKGSKIFINFWGETIFGNGCSLKLINRFKQDISVLSLNSKNIINEEHLKYYIIIIFVPAHSKNTITKIDFMKNYPYDLISDDYFTNDTLVISPGYPSLNNRYNSAFVHTRVKAYQKANFKVDVAFINEFNTTSIYEYDGVKVFKGNFYDLRDLLQRKTFKKILIHFFDNRFANVLETVDLSQTQLYFYLHGAETLYRDWTKIASPYFGKPAIIDSDLETLFKEKDFFIKKYNDRKNAKWIFVTEWTQKRCEELLNIKFNNADVISCLINTDLFSYEKKNIELRKKIFIIRKFDDINSYSIDIDVRIILELSHRPFFKELEFDIYGDGSLFDEILEPLKQFENVHLHRTFLDHNQIREVHETHGIALFPTRFDSQAVSSCEAAASGCAVITSKIPGVMQFIPDNLGVLCNTENYKEYADVIEKMYNDSDYFLKVGKEESKSVTSKFDFEHTIQKELNMFKTEKEIKKYFNFPKIEDPILTVVIPAYNVEKYVKNTIISLIDQPYANKLEILVVNDGSKDNTLKIAKDLEKLTTIGNKSIIKVINKENGGHGSTINKGIELATGKYLKVIDGDDTVDSEEFAKLIKKLENEDSDIILNNYIEDFAILNELKVQKIYSLLKENIQYKFDDLCYKNYGFTSWGPILSCSTYKTEMLKKANFKLSHNMFYVDMELNINVAICCKTIKYFDLNIYRYLLGREGQSVNKKSYIKNYKHHENVTINLIEIYNKNEANLSESRKNYIINKLILPMVSTQYEICINYFNKGNPFREFDKRLKKYSNFYNNSFIKIRKVRFHRATNGYLIWLNSFLVKLSSVIKKIIRF